MVVPQTQNNQINPQVYNQQNQQAFLLENQDSQKQIQAAQSQILSQNKTVFQNAATNFQQQELACVKEPELEQQKHLILQQARPLLNKLQQLLPQIYQINEGSRESPKSTTQAQQLSVSTPKKSQDNEVIQSELKNEKDCIDQEEESINLVEGENCENKHFDGIPTEWHETIKVWNRETKRAKLYFRCKFKGCESVFRKSCNLRDHFRKHTMQRPYQCDICKKFFTQSGNLGRHLKNVHSISRAVPIGSQPKFQICKKMRIKTTKRSSESSEFEN